MKKTIAGIGIVGLVALVWFVFQGSTVDYVATMDDEVSKLEMELVDAESAVVAGILTATEAAEIQEKVFTRLKTINSSVSSSQKSTLSDSQTMMLQNGLDRLKNVLTKYQATLVVVDEAVLGLPEAERLKLSRGGGGRKALPESLTETIETVEDYVADEVEDYVLDEDKDIANAVASSSDETVDEGTEENMEENAIEEGEVKSDEFEEGGSGTSTDGVTTD